LKILGEIMSRFFAVPFLCVLLSSSLSFAHTEGDKLNHPAGTHAGGIDLGLTGAFYGYMNVTDQDTAAAQSVRKFDILRDTEIEFTGETLLQNGTSVGAMIEVGAQSGDDFEVSKSYLYTFGTWGRVDFGTSDGAAHLLHIETPGADPAIDGGDPKVQPVNYNAAGLNTGVRDLLREGLGYMTEFTSDSDKITYLTPVLLGTQLGVSYTPDINDNSRRTNGNALDNQEGVMGDAWDIAYRYERDLNDDVKFAVGAGYTHGNIERKPDSIAPAPVGNFTDDYQEWNAGLQVNINALGLGAVYTTNNGGRATNGDIATWVLGADYALTDTLTLGASYLNRAYDLGVVSSSQTLDTDRYAVGARYKIGPGVTLSGTLVQTNNDVPAVAGSGDMDATSLLLGTKISF
jgi:outer membrane protein OmpU